MQLAPCLIYFTLISKEFSTIINEADQTENLILILGIGSLKVESDFGTCHRVFEG